MAVEVGANGTVVALSVKADSKNEFWPCFLLFFFFLFHGVLSNMASKVLLTKLLSLTWLVKDKPPFCTKKAKISHFGRPVMAKSNTVRDAEVCTLDQVVVVLDESLLVLGCCLEGTRMGQHSFSTNHWTQSKDPPMTAQWTGNMAS